LHFHVAAQAHAISYHHVLPNAAVFAQLAARHQVSEVPDATAGTNAAAVVEHGAGMSKIGKRIGHESR
jgi:hypothetical protein